MTGERRLHGETCPRLEISGSLIESLASCRSNGSPFASTSIVRAIASGSSIGNSGYCNFSSLPDSDSHSRLRFVFKR
jgi:hypothetical protein